jgi:hypothetical protein
MPMFTIHLYDDGAAPLRTQQLAAADAGEARCWATNEVTGSPTFRRARIYDGEKLLSEVGYRVNPPAGWTTPTP